MTELQSTPIRLDFFEKPWEKNANSIWIASTLNLHRNLEKFNFPKHLDGEKRKLVSEMLLKALKENPCCKDMAVYELDKLSPVDKDFFSEHFLIFDLPHEGHREQILILDRGGATAILINSLDHVELYTVDVDHDLEKRFDQLLTYEQAIEQQLPYAFSNHFGYLTADPTLAGTGLLVQAYLHIPAICFQNKAHTYTPPKKLDDIIYTSLQGEQEPLLGNLLVLKNRYATGVSEEAIISSIRNTTSRIVAEEQSAREQLMQKPDPSIIDAISRAIGTLLYAYAIDTKEALQALSLIKFGIEITLVQGINLEAINELFFDCRRGHLAKKIDQSAHTNEEIYKIRAQYLKNALQGISLRTCPPG